MIDHALWYAAMGMRVFPCDDRKRPLTTNGFKDATTDERRIKEWWEKWPDANIAHRPVGRVVFDLDPVRISTYDSSFAGFDDWTWDPPDGLNSIALFFSMLTEDETKLVDRTQIVVTGRGGIQVTLDDPDGVFTCSAGRLGRGIDTRTGDGYVILPPSSTVFETRDHGRVRGRYKFMSAPPGEVEIQAVPVSLVERFLDSRRRAPSTNSRDDSRARRVGRPAVFDDSEGHAPGGGVGDGRARQPRGCSTWLRSVRVSSPPRVRRR